MTILTANELELAIQSIEHSYVVSVTIIDREGYFHDHAGQALFSRLRHSHQRNPACKKQFDNRCVQHCRYQINEIGEQKRCSFEHSCWKGISEIAVPLFLGNNHLGTCFVGQWKSPDPAQDPRENSFFQHDFLSAYTLLPEYDSARVLSLQHIAQFLGQSLVLHVQQLKSQSPMLHPRQQEIMDFIQQKPGADLSLENLATHLSLSPSRCSHVVKEICNASLHELIHTERMKRACQLLRNSDRSAQEIAHIIGFNDQFYFNKAFKAAHGLAPGQYRKQDRR